jgi:hypothetical protein
MKSGKALSHWVLAQRGQEWSVCVGAGRMLVSGRALEPWIRRVLWRMETSLQVGL